MTPKVTLRRLLRSKAKYGPVRDKVMECEFCHSNLPGSAPENVLLLDHVRTNQSCKRDYNHLLENLRTSWTANMSGG